MKNFLLTLALLAGTAQAQTAAQNVTTTSSTPQSSTAPSYPSGYTFRQMLDALGTLRGIELRGVGFDERGYLNLTLADDAARQQVIDRVAAAGLPTGVLAFGGVPYAGGTGSTGASNTGTGSSTGTVSETPATPTAPVNSSLPTEGQALAQPHRAELSGPQTVRAGEANTWSFNLVNTGNSAINLQHGACDVRFEVLNAAGAVVRPNQTNTVCTMQLIVTDVAPGQTREVQKIRWEGKDSAGQPVPAGEYTIRAVFRGAGVVSGVAEMKVTVQ